jgi:exopolysaccharide production protein ExoQ
VVSPQVAGVVCLIVIVCLLARDTRRCPEVSHVLWIPLAWVVIIASRSVSDWLYGPTYLLESPDAYLEGSAIDRNVFLGLMIVGALVLWKRSISLASLVRRNVAISVFFGYSLMSVVWSEFPMIALKRWQKVIGNVIMALIVLTERSPNAAVGALLRRCAYVLIPLSVLLIKYYPDVGRAFSSWSGEAFNVGVTTNKNALGILCLVSGLLFLASLLSGLKNKGVSLGAEPFIYCGFLVAIVWLLNLAHSATSVLAGMVGAAALFGLRVTVVRRHLTGVCLAMAVVVGVLEATTDLSNWMIEGVGRDPTLTGRTELWEVLATIQINPVVGTGFESFWLGPRAADLWRRFWWQPNQAHNGYYEMYLNLGIIGVVLLGAMILAGYVKARGMTRDDADSRIGAFGVAFLFALVLVNMTDATFKATHLAFFVFFLVAIDIPRDAGRRQGREKALGPLSRQIVAASGAMVVGNRPGGVSGETRGGTGETGSWIRA